jgi:hypothetical protein
MGDELRRSGERATIGSRSRSEGALVPSATKLAFTIAERNNPLLTRG